MKTPKLRIRVEFPITKTAIKKRYGWKAAGVIKTPDYASKNGKTTRWRTMPTEEFVENNIIYSLTKAIGVGWAEMEIVALKNKKTDICIYANGTKQQMTQLARRFIINHSSIRHNMEAQWLSAEALKIAAEYPKEAL